VISGASGAQQMIATTTTLDRDWLGPRSLVWRGRTQHIASSTCRNHYNLIKIIQRSIGPAIFEIDD
jgi:hypothetical protein